MGLSAKSLVDYSVNEIKRTEHSFNISEESDQPISPMLVVYVGDSDDQHEELKSLFFDNWPRFKSTIRFYKAEEDENGKAVLYDMDDPSVPLSMGKVRKAIGEMKDSDSGFREYHKLMLYFIFKTDKISDMEEFEKRIELIEKIKEGTRDDNNTLVFLLLDEAVDMEEVSEDIRLDLRKRLDPEFISDDSYIILSNRLANKSTIVKNDNRIRVVASTIFLSNSGKGDQLYNASNPILTVDYACEEKDYHKMGNIIVKRLVTHITKTLRENERENAWDDLYPRLSINSRGCFNILAHYLNGNDKIRSILNYLYYFPRRYVGGREDFYNMTSNQFNTETMGAWHCYLYDSVNKISNSLLADANRMTEWREQYKSYLRQTFSVSELVELYKSIDDIKNQYERKIMGPGADAPLTESLMYIYMELLSKNKKVSGIFFEAMESVGKQAADCSKLIKELTASSQELRDIGDSEFEAFYGQIADNYLEQNSSSINNLYMIGDETELENSIKEILKSIIRNNEIFRKTFVDELEERLINNDNNQKAQDYIYGRLTNIGNIKTYLYTRQNLGEMVLSSLLLKTGTPLHRYLTGERVMGDSVTTSYNTGSDRSCEYITYKQVYDYNL